MTQQDSTAHAAALREAADVLARAAGAQSADPADLDNRLEFLNQQASEARRLLAHLEKTRDDQPSKLAEMRGKAEQERDRARVEEPWLDHVGAIPSYTSDGENLQLAGMMALPTIAAKDVWGARLAFDVASSDRPANDVVMEYFGDIRDPEHLMFVFASAIDTLADHVIKPMLDVIEQKASDYEMRVRLADAARNAWVTRISEISRATEEGE